MAELVEGLEEIGEMVAEMVVKMEEILAEEKIVQEVKPKITLEEEEEEDGGYLEQFLVYFVA